MLHDPDIFAYSYTFINAERQRTPSVRGGIASNTKLATASGWKCAGEILPGDHVLTFDNGMRTVSNVSKKKLCAYNDSLPLFIPVGAVGNTTRVSYP